jgi:hypothetical protein
VKPQLLCTFAHLKDLELVIDYIAQIYEVAEHRAFVFSNESVPSELFVTYNVIDSVRRTPNTILIHRKKESNTLYTVNALNTIIRRANNGVLDKTFQIDWSVYENSLILGDDADLRHIYLKLFKRITI